MTTEFLETTLDHPIDGETAGSASDATSDRAASAGLPPSIAGALLVVVVSGLFTYPGSAAATRDFAARFAAFASVGAASGTDERSPDRAMPQVPASSGLAGVGRTDATRL